MTDHTNHIIKKHGKTKAGKQRWYCFFCNETFTPDASPRGNKPKGDRAMSDAERQKSKRLRDKEKRNKEGKQ